MDKFDVSKVLTAVTKNQAVIGGEGWFADTISTLERKCRNESPDKLKEIQDNPCRLFPFGADRGGAYLYFYPLCAKSYVVPVLRTYTDNELNNLVGTVVMSKGWKIRRMITGKLASIDRISVDGQEMSANTLLENYTHIDGSPCGVEV